VPNAEPAPPFREGGDRKSTRLSQLEPNSTILALRRVNERQLRRRCQIEEIFRLDHLRSLIELLEELVRHGLGDQREPDYRIAAYAAVDAEFLKALDGPQLPPLPLQR
jgi:hypothetical protein